MKINNFQNIIFVRNLYKSYTEGVYADTPQNRKLGRVGMSYAVSKKEKSSEYTFDVKQLKLALENNIRFNYFNQYYDFEFSLFNDKENQEHIEEEKQAIIEEYQKSTIQNLDFVELSSYLEKAAAEVMSKTDYPIDPSKTRKVVSIYEGGMVKFGIVFESQTIDDYDEESGENIPYSYKIALQRTFKRIKPTNELVCYHDEFDMSQVYQKKGFSKIVLKKLFDEYQKMGVDEVRLCANMEIGGYCWGKYGFMTTIDQIHPILEVAEFDKIITKEQRNEVTKLVLTKYQNKSRGNVFPMNLIAELPYGFKLLKGSNWQGFMDLHDKEQMSIFYDYLNYK